MPYINIQMTDDGISAEKKSEVISAVTQVMVDLLDKTPETTFVVIQEVPIDNWGYCGQSVSDRRRQKNN